MQRLLRVLSVALEHLRLQLGADRSSVPGSAEEGQTDREGDRQEVPMSSGWQRSYSKHFGFISEHDGRRVKHRALWYQGHIQGCAGIFNNSNTHAQTPARSDPP